jgi:hypothetical protein
MPINYRIHNYLSTASVVLQKLFCQLSNSNATLECKMCEEFTYFERRMYFKFISNLLNHYENAKHINFFHMDFFQFALTLMITIQADLI